jgi:hypothetical protein
MKLTELTVEQAEAAPAMSRGAAREARARLLYGGQKVHKADSDGGGNTSRFGTLNAEFGK